MDITKKQANITCLIILAIGLLLKLIYAWQVPYNISPHDLLEVSNWQAFTSGHLGYIQYLFEFRTFPPYISEQFYHPPLFYIIGALIFQCVLSEKTMPATINAFEIVQYVNMVFAFITTVYIYRILKKLQVKPIWLVLITAFLTLQPCFYIIGTEINNDCLMTMFSVMAIFYTVSWIQKQSMKNTCFIAISVVAAMLSKQSGALITFGVIAVFLYVLIKNLCLKDIKNFVNLIKQFLVFILSVTLLGLSWTIRNVISHNVSFTHITRLSDDSPMYLGNCTLFERLGLPNFEQLFGNSIDFSNSTDYANIWGQLALTMSFDEHILNIKSTIEQILAVNLLWLNAIMFIIMTVIMVKMLFIKNIKTEYKILISVGYITLMGSFIKFAFDYPFVCSMNFRYIVCSLIFLGMAIGLERSLQEKFRTNSTTLISLLMLIISIFASILYVIAAV